MEDLVLRLEEFRQAKIREGHFLVTGARGIGKSIFTRAALSRFARSNGQAICITIDSRGIGYRPFLQRFAKQLAEEVIPRAEQGKRQDVLLWVRQLLLLATHPQITRSQAETTSRKYGVDAKVGADLLYKLEGRFSWEETRSLGTTIQTTLSVTDELLHSAICETLVRLEAEPWIIVVFFDDLDQAVGGESEAEVEALFRKILDLRPCISLVHFRTEVLVENVAREAGEKIEIPALDSEHLFEILQRRLQDATEEVRTQFPAESDASWEAVRRLARLNGNPFVFLQWVHGLLRTQRWPVGNDWNSEANLGRIVLESPLFTGVEPELLIRLMKVVDRFDSTQVLDKNTLLRKSLLADPSGSPENGANSLSSEEIDLLVRFHVLLPRVRFQPELGYRTQPVLNLLRPSVQKKL